jgi:hypothetical protein
MSALRLFPILSSFTKQPSVMPVIQLECQCNNYPWGKKGKESLAARYAASTPGGHFKLDESNEYAEVGPQLIILFPGPALSRKKIRPDKDYTPHGY